MSFSRGEVSALYEFQRDWMAGEIVDSDRLEVETAGCEVGVLLGAAMVVEVA